MSTIEKIKLAFIKNIEEEKEIFLIDGVLEILDSENKKNIIKLLINLKKFYNKTILISCIDVDMVYSFIDNLILIIDGKVVSANDKYSLFEKGDNKSIYVPFIKKIENIVYKKSNINLGNNDNINELIKAIYREVR